MPEIAKSRRLAKRHDARFKRRALLPLLRYLAALAAGGRIPGLNGAIERRARQVGVSSRTLYRWLRRLRDFGEAGLEFAPRSDKGCSAKFADRRLAVAFVCGRLVQGFSAAAIHRALAEEWRKLYADRPPSYDTVRNFVRVNVQKEERTAAAKILPAVSSQEQAQTGGAAREALPAPAPSASPSAERVAVPEELQEQARARFEAVSPLLDFRESRGKPVRLTEGGVASTLTELVEHVAGHQKPPISAATLWRWLARWDDAKKNGTNAYAALCKGQRSDAKGPGSKFFAEHKLAEIYLQKKYSLDGAEGQPSAYDAWEALVRDWKTIGESGNPPSYDTCRGYLQSLPQGLKTLARDGAEAYVAECSPFIIRGKQPVMKTWISDHRQHDVLVRNTLYAEMRPGEAYRPWLTAIYDMGSHLIVGYCFSPGPNWRTIHSAIRMGAMEFGFPQEFYWDNGKDFAKAKRGLEEITVSREVMGFPFRVTSAIPKHPRSKPIEAYFTRISKKFDPMWGCAYLGNSAKNRPEAAEDAQREHKKWLEGKARTSPLPSDAQFLKAAVQWIAEYNAQARLESLEGRTPNEVMEEAWPERKRVKVNPRSLDILLWEPVTRVVRAGGCVEMDKMRYEPTEQSLFALSALQGQTVHILRDPYNLADAVAVTEQRVFIGELRLQEFIAQDAKNPITRDQIQAAMREQRRLKKGYAQHIALLGLLAEHWGWKNERDRLIAEFEATGTDGTALPAAAPGALRRGQLPRPRVQQLLQPAFVSDAVEEDAEIFRDVATGD